MLDNGLISHRSMQKQVTGNAIPPTYLSNFHLILSNSPIEATIKLFGRQKSRYVVDAQTSNSPVGLKFPTSPLDPIINIKAITSNGPATVDTHPTFQGTFMLTTTDLDVSIDQSRDTRDPSGQGRSREFEYTEIKTGSVMGQVYWGEINPPKDPFSVPGVIIQTTNSPTTLIV